MRMSVDMFSRLYVKYTVYSIDERYSVKYITIEVVDCNDNKSDLLGITTGLPLASILESLHFIICIKVMKK